MMRGATTIFVLALLSGGPSAARSQEQSHPATEKSSSKPGKAVAQDPAKATADDKPPSANSAADQGQPSRKSSATDNPFPEEESKSAAKEVEAGKSPAEPADLSGVNPSTDGEGHPPHSKNAAPDAEGKSSSRTRLEGLDDTDPDALRKANKSVAEPVHNSKLAADDAAIGKMYFQSDNYRGAYIRYKEALSLDPESADAAFGLAESARKLSQTEEAMQNYKLCLDLDPDGPRAKAARRALTSLASRSSH